MPPRFSVVIPTYNQADFLRVALRSVAAQTFQDFEVIVVNNFSDDHTLQVVEQANDPRIKAINSANQGVIGAGRNAGIKAASAPYVAFLDSDDTWAETKLERTAKAIEEHPEAGLFSHIQEMVWEGPAPSKTFFGPPPGFSGNVYEYLLLFGNLLATSSAVVSRQRLDEVDGFSEDPAMMTAEDYDLWLKLARVCEFHFIPEVLGSNLFHEASASSDIERHLAGILAVLDVHCYQAAGATASIYPRRVIKKRYSSVYYYAGRRLQRTGLFRSPLGYYAKAIRTYPLYLKTYGALGLMLADRILGQSRASRIAHTVRSFGRKQVAQ